MDPRWIPYDPLMLPVWIQDETWTDPWWSQYGSNMDPGWPLIEQVWIQDGSWMTPYWSHHESNMGPRWILDAADMDLDDGTAVRVLSVIL